MLGKLSLRYQLLLMVFIPILTLLLLATLLMQQSSQRATRSELIAALVESAIANADLVHEQQKERGLTAAFIGSGGSAEFANKLAEQRKLTDKEWQQVFASFEQNAALFAEVGLTPQLKRINDDYAQITTIRQQINEQQIALSAAIGFYTKLNADLLSLNKAIAQQADEQEVTRNAFAYYYFAQAKERAGIERAVLSNTFAADKFGPGMFAKWIALQALQQTYLYEFSAIAPDDVLDIYKTMKLSPIFTKVVNFRQIAEDKAELGNFEVNAADWFAASTARINELKKLEERISSNLKQRASANAESNRQQWWTVLTLIAVVLTLSLLLVFWILKNIGISVNEILSKLTQSIQHNDLSQQLKSQGNAEFAKIASAINELFSHFKSTISTLNSASTQLASTAHKTTETIEQSSYSLREQQAQSQQVATAVEELSASIKEVARSTQQAADAASDADTLAENSQGVIRNSVMQVSEVADQVIQVDGIIKQINESSVDIANMLDVIKSVAEQTNLLALNAAIEAARAGEQGRGFAVVADEVRGLAQRTQESTAQIEEIITRFTNQINQAFQIIESGQQSAKQSVDLAEDANTAIAEILNAIVRIKEMNLQIASAIEQQTVVTSEVSQSINAISDASLEAANATEQIAETSREQAEMAKSLHAVAVAFRV